MSSAHTSAIEREKSACIAVAVTFMREGQLRMDAIRLAMQYLNWAPNENHVALISEAMRNNAREDRERIFADLRLRSKQPTPPIPTT